MSFTGFPPGTYSFLRDLKRNNSRDWFQQNKTRYEQHVVEPMQEFILAMQGPLQKLSPHFIADPRRVGGSMFRIYRDTRFARDKTPYKTNAGCQFRHEAGRDVHAPGFYLHLEPGNVFFGGGIWMPPNPSLDKVRMVIDSFPKSWEKVLGDKKLIKAGGVRGDGLVRPPRGYAAEHPYLEDLKRKNFFVMQSCAQNVTHNKAFVREVEKGFQAAAPLVKFLTRALELPF